MKEFRQCRLDLALPLLLLDSDALRLLHILVLRHLLALFLLNADTGKTFLASNVISGFQESYFEVTGYEYY